MLGVPEMPGRSSSRSPLGPLGPKTSDDLTVDAHTAPALNTRAGRPAVPSSLPSRERLLGRLDEAPPSSLIAVSAPAGYGKSTVLSQWLQTRALVHAWLSLDGGDSDPAIFAQSLLGACRSAFKNRSVPGGLRHSGRGLRAREQALALTQCLEQLGAPLVLVLDDYHRAASAGVDELVAAMLEDLPAAVRLVIASRYTLPSRLLANAARGKLTTIGQSDLRLRTAEVTRLVQRYAVGSLDDTELGPVLQLVDGWPLALSLIERSLHGSMPLAEAGLNLAQQREHMVAHILGSLSPKLRRGLARLALFDRFCEPLFIAIEAGATEDFRTLMHHAGIMCVGPIGERGWYRFHRLFADALRECLQGALTATQAAEARAQASGWFASRGLIEEAIAHALRGGNTQLADALLARPEPQDHAEPPSAVARTHASDSSLPVATPELTPRELDVLLLLGRRMSNKEIAGELHISEATVKRHAHSIYAKLGVSGRRAAARAARQLHLAAGP